MIYRIKGLLILGLLVLSCGKSKDKIEKENAEENVTLFAKEETNSYASSEHLIHATELIELSKQENVKIIDFRKAKGYAEGHIVEALNVWRPDITDNSYPYGGMMAKKEDIETLFSTLGIQNDDLLVVYDDRGGCDAARLWWLLKIYNFNSVKILNGGLELWKKAGGIINAEVVSITPSQFVLPANSSPDLLIRKEQVLEIVKSDKKVAIIDTRSTDEYSGKEQNKGAFKAGRIPKSVHIDWTEAIDYSGTQKLKSVAALEKIYSKLGVSKTDPIIVYCHSGVRSAHTTFILTELLGYKNVKNYDGSWTEWSYFNEFPFEKDNVQQNK